MTASLPKKSLTAVVCVARGDQSGFYQKLALEAGAASPSCLIALICSRFCSGRFCYSRNLVDSRGKVSNALALCPQPK